MTLQSLKILCLEKITRNLHKLYLICLHHSIKIPHMIGQQVYDYTNDGCLQEADYLFFSKKVCTISEISITENVLKSFCHPKMKLGHTKSVKIQNLSFIDNKDRNARLSLFQRNVERYKEKGFKLFCKNLCQIVKSIENLDICNCYLNKRKRKTLINSLKYCKNLKTIRLKDNSWYFNKEFFEIIRKRNGLLNFSLQNTVNCSFNDSFSLGNFLKRCKKLKMISLAHNVFDYSEIFKSLESCKECLEIIDLESCYLSENDLENFLNLLPKLTRISHVNLYNCESWNYSFSAEIFFNLHKVIKNLKTIQHINLPESNEINNLAEEANTEFKDKRV